MYEQANKVIIFKLNTGYTVPVTTILSIPRYWSCKALILTRLNWSCKLLKDLDSNIAEIDFFPHNNFMAIKTHGHCESH